MIDSKSGTDDLRVTWPAGTDVLLPKDSESGIPRWRKLDDGRIEAVYTRDEFETAVRLRMAEVELIDPAENALDTPAWRELLVKAKAEETPGDPYSLFGALKAMRLIGVRIVFDGEKARLKTSGDPGEYAFMREEYLKPHAELLKRLLGEMREPERPREPDPEPIPVRSYEQAPMPWKVGGHLDGTG